MNIFHIVIKGCKDGKDINQVLDSLAILFKCNAEQLRPMLVSKNFIAKRSLELESAKKYQKVLEDAGCIAVIESELSFDNFELVQASPPEELQSPVQNVASVQEDNKTHLSESNIIQQSISPYYARRFKIFDAEGGAFKPTFNGYALLFGIFWYFYKGLWAKAALMILICVTTFGFPAPLFWLYCAIAGNYDYYLLKRYKTHLWSRNGVPAPIENVSYASRTNAVRNDSKNFREQTPTSSSPKKWNGFKIAGALVLAYVFIIFIPDYLSFLKKNEAYKDEGNKVIDTNSGSSSLRINEDKAINPPNLSSSLINATKKYRFNTITSTGIQIIDDLWDIAHDHSQASTICLTTYINGVDEYGNAQEFNIGTLVMEAGDLTKLRKYKDKSYLNASGRAGMDFMNVIFFLSNPNGPYCRGVCETYREQCPSESPKAEAKDVANQSSKNESVFESKNTDSNTNLAEIVSHESNNFLGNYYVVKLKPSGFIPINVNIKANTPEEALAKVVKKDDFLFVRRDKTSEEVYTARFGKIIQIYSSFTVPESSPVGASYQNGRLGSEEQSVKFEGYSGLDGQTAVITAKRFFVLRDDSLIADLDYIWNFESNQEQYHKGLKAFESSIINLGTSKSDFNPDDASQWSQIMIPATQALLVATLTGKQKEVQSIYSKLSAKFGTDPVDFLKEKLDLRVANTIKNDALAKAQQEQKQILTDQDQSINSQVKSPTVQPVSQISIKKTGLNQDEFKRAIGMSKQDIKNKFGPPDNTMDNMWVYFDLYNPDTGKIDHYNNCSLFFIHEIVDHVRC